MRFCPTTINQLNSIITFNIIKGYAMNESKYDFKYRLDLDNYQIESLQRFVKLIKLYDEDDLIMLNELKEIINNPKKIKHSSKKYIAALEATEARTAKAKKKIQNAINILRMENKKLTHYSIAKTAKVSYLTVKKYISLDEIE